MSHRNPVVYTNRVKFQGIPPASRMASFSYISAKFSRGERAPVQYRYKITNSNKWFIHIMDIFTWPVAYNKLLAGAASIPF